MSELLPAVIALLGIPSLGILTIAYRRRGQQIDVLAAERDGYREAARDARTIADGLRRSWQDMFSAAKDRELRLVRERDTARAALNSTVATKQAYPRLVGTMVVTTPARLKSVTMRAQWEEF